MTEENIPTVYHEQLEAILANAVDAIITIDESGTILTVNPGTEGMFGFSAPELIGGKINQLMPSPYRSEHDNYLTQYFETGDRKIIGSGREVTGRRKDGSIFPIHLAVTEIHVGDKRLFNGIVRDISDLKAVEKKLVQNERLAAIGQMMAGLAHESRNVFQRCHACLTNLAYDVREMPDSVELIDKVQNALDHLNGLLDEVRDYSAPVVLEKTPTNIGSLVQEMWQQIATAHQEFEGIVFTQSQSEDFPEKVSVDRLRIGQVIWNLLENAAAACEAPHGVIQVELYCEVQSSLPIRVRIADDGDGISPEFIREIFEPFFTTKTKGTGLGLAMCKRIVEAHDGMVIFTNAMGGGAEFTLALPKLPMEK